MLPDPLARNCSIGSSRSFVSLLDPYLGRSMKEENYVQFAVTKKNQTLCCFLPVTFQTWPPRTVSVLRAMCRVMGLRSESLGVGLRGSVVELVIL